MGKIKSKVDDISCQRGVETDTEAMAKTGFKVVKKTMLLALELIGSILISLFVGIIGCSDMPYTGSMLTADDVDRYLVSAGEDTFASRTDTIQFV